jgi:hypothetical protein
MTLSTPVKIVALGALAIVLALGGVLLLTHKPASASPPAVTPPTQHVFSAVKAKVQPHKSQVKQIKLLPGLPSTVRSALEKHAVVVVAIYSSRNAGDRAVLAEVRSGARAAHAGFLAANVALNPVAAGVATWSSSVSDPATFVVRRPGKIVFAVNGPTDSDAIAQAAISAR